MRKCLAVLAVLFLAVPISAGDCPVDADFCPDCSGAPPIFFTHTEYTDWGRCITDADVPFEQRYILTYTTIADACTGETLIEYISDWDRERRDCSVPLDNGRGG